MTQSLREDLAQNRQTPMPIDVVPLERRHWEAVRSIFREGIATGDATFETEPPSWESWDASHLPFARLAGVAGGDVVGWAALSPVSSRCAYEGVAEVSVYVVTSHHGKGVGSILLQTLIRDSEAGGIWTLQAGIFPENTASLALHRRAGFREVGRRERLGKLHGRWRDVVLLERRSRLVGLD